MAEHVTSIRVNTEVDASDLEEVQKNLDKIEKKVESVSAKTNSAKKKTGLKWTEEEKREAEAQIDAILEKKKKLDESPKVQDESWDRGNTDFDWNKQAEDMAAVNEQLSKIQAEMSKNGSEAQRMSEHYNLLRTDVEAYAEELKGLEAQGKYFGDADYDKVYIAWKNAKDAVMEYAAELNKQTASGQAQEAAKVAKEQEKQAAAQRKIEEAAERIRQKDIARFEKEAKAQEKLQAEAAEQARLNALKDNAVIADERMVFLLERQKELKSYLNDLEKAGVTAGYAEHDNATRELTQVNSLIAARKRLSETVNEQKRGFAKLAETSKKCFGTIHKGTKKSNGVLSKLKSRLNGIALSLLVFNWITKGFNAMVSAMKAGFQNLAKYSNDYNTAMSEMKSECAELKNNLAAAFEPIVTAVIPYITQLVSWLNTAMESISKFMATFSGKSTYTKAKKQVVDYAKSLESASDSAKGALAAFDDISVLNKDESGSSAGGEVTGADAFEEVPIEDVSDWTQQFKDALENGDWYGLGALLAEKMNEAVSNISFDGIGRKIAEKLNDAVYFIQGFLNTFDFKEVGAKFAEIANEVTIAIQNIDWAAVADTFSSGIIAAFDTVSGFIENVDWATFGKSLYEALIDFIANIDWEGFTESLFEFLGAALGGLGAFIAGIVIGAWEDIKQAWSDVVSWWQDIAYEDGEFTMEGLLNGILEKLKDIGTWIREHIFQPFINGFKKAFGIHSPSTVMQEMGGYIIEGLKNGLSGIWEKVQDIIEKLKVNIRVAFLKIKFITISIFTELKERVKSIFTGMWTSIKNTINSIIAGVEKMVNSVINGINGMINALNRLSFDIPEWVPELGGKTFGLNISTIGEVSLPRLATGCVTNGPTKAIIGEAGREAVLPLENNTGWMDDLSDKLAARIHSGSSGPVYLQIDGQAFARLEGPYRNAENARIGVNFG